MPRTNTYSEEEMTTAIRRAAAELGDGVSSGAYDTWSRSHDDAPSARAVINRFGSWNVARSRAGFDPAPSVRDYVEHWTRAACRESLQEWLLSRPFRLSAKAYGEWATGHPDRASLATVRNKFGGWTAALDAARREDP